MRSPTARQRELLGHIRAFIETSGYPPTIRELCRLMGTVSTNGMAEALDVLQAKGLIERDAKVARGIRVVATAEAA